MTIYAETLQAREDIGFAPVGLDEPYRVFISEDGSSIIGPEITTTATFYFPDFFYSFLKCTLLSKSVFFDEDLMQKFFEGDLK